MPCNTIVTNTVELNNPNMDPALMEAAIREAFGNVSRYGERFTWRVDGYNVELSGGRLRSQLDATRLQDITGRVKREYSKEVQKFAAKRFGWALKFGADGYTFEMTKS